MDKNEKQLLTKSEADSQTTKAAVGVGGIVAVVVAIIAAGVGWVWYSSWQDTPGSVATDVGNTTGVVIDRTRDAAGVVVDRSRDAAVEIPQAASDAVTAGDQPTTRPNADGSTDKLDQK